MTIKELVTDLSKYPDNLEVYVFDGADYCPDAVPANGTRLINMDGNGRYWEEVKYEGLHTGKLQVLIRPLHG